MTLSLNCALTCLRVHASYVSHFSTDTIFILLRYRTNGSFLFPFFFFFQPDIKRLQIQLTGFLDKDTPTFCKDLWNLCLSAQSSPQGVPKELLEAKKLELMQEKVCNQIYETE